MPRLRELQRPHHAAPVVRVDRGGRGRIDGRQRGVRPSRPTIVVKALCGVTDAVRCLGRERHVGERRPHVEAAPAAHDGDPAAVEDLVDRSVGEVRILGDGALVARLPHGDEMVRDPLAVGRGRLVGQDRQPAVELHRVARDDLAAEHVGQLERDGALARGGGPEDRDDRHRV